MKKVFSICLAIMLLVISCPSLAEDKTELTLLRLGDLVKAEPIFTPIVEGFEKEYPQYEVKFEAMGWSEAVTKLPLLAAQGQLPDVYFVNTWNLAFDGYLMDLNDMLAADKTLSADLPESILSTCRLSGGELYLMPCAAGAFSLWYNKEIFKQAGLDPNAPPKTIDEMIEYAQIITAKTGIPGLGWGMANLEDTGHITMSFYSSYTGADIWDDATRTFTFENNKEYRAAFAEVLDLMRKITIEYGITQPNPVEINPYGIRPLFRDGQVAMYLDGVWAVKELLPELEKGEDSKFSTALFPAGPAGSRPVMGVGAWGLPKNTRHPEGAYALLSYLMRSDNQTRHATMWGLLPILESEKTKDAFKYPYWNALIAQTANVTPLPKDPQSSMIVGAITEYTQAAALGSMTPEEAIEGMIQAVKSSLVQ